MSGQAFLHIADYVVIGVLLLIPFGLGILFAVKDSKRATRNEYLFGGRRLAVIPVTLSLFVSFASAISLMGIPTDQYTYGAMFTVYSIGISLANAISAVTLVPLIYPLHLTSLYEYLAMRFQSHLLKMLVVIIGMLQTTCYLAIALVTPALALQTSAGIPIWISIVIVGVIGTIYTAVGGIKSVVWTDAFQAFIMAGGILMIIIRGVSAAGGIRVAWKVAEAGGRTSFTEFSLDPRTRHTWYGMVVGGMFHWMGHIFSQPTFQRICAMKTLKKAKISSFMNIPIVIIFWFTLFLSALAMYAYFHAMSCDPYEGGLITNRNQLAPFFVLHSFHDLPGLPGFYMAALFSGALSTLSSGINGLAANTVEDILTTPLKNVRESTAILITKVIVCAYGLLIVGFAYAASSLRGPVSQLTASVVGAIGSPMVGIFILGAIIPWTNKYGAFSGLLSALAVNIWMVVGQQMYGKKHRVLPPPPTDMCLKNESQNLTFALAKQNVTESFVPTMPVSNPYENGFFFYDVSYEWYGFIGTFLSFTIGVMLSYFTRNSCTSTPDPRLTVPILRNIWSLPEPLHTAADESDLELPNLGLTISKKKGKVLSDTQICTGNLDLLI